MTSQAIFFFKRSTKFINSQPDQSGKKREKNSQELLILEITEWLCLQIPQKLKKQENIKPTL